MTLTHMIIEAASQGSGSSIWDVLGPIFSGVAELLLALGAGVGFVIRYRRKTRGREDETAEEVTRASIELDRQYKERIAQYEESIQRMNESARIQEIRYEKLQEAFQRLQDRYDKLTSRLLESRRPPGEDSV